MSHRREHREAPQARMVPVADWLAPARVAVGGEVTPGVDVRWRFESPTVALTSWRCRAQGPGPRGPKHLQWHTIAFLRGGSFRLRCAAGDGVADSTRLAFYNPMVGFDTAHPCACGDHGGSLVLREDTARALVAEHDARAAEGPAEHLFGRALAPCDSELRMGLSSLLASLGSAPPGHLERVRLEETLIDLSARAIAGPLPPPAGDAGTIAARPHRERILAIQESLWLGMERPLRLRDLAAQVGFSVFQLCRHFRALTGLPVHRYLTRLRLNRALELIEEGAGADLTGMALDLGFTSHSHFSSAFRSEFGATPSNHRSRVGPRQIGGERRTARFR